MNVTQFSGGSIKWNLLYPWPVTATCLLILHNNHWYIADFMRDYHLYANIKPPKAREKTIKILFVSQIISFSFYNLLIEAYRSCLDPEILLVSAKLKIAYNSFNCSPIPLLKPIFGHSFSSLYFYFNLFALFLSVILSHVAWESHRRTFYPISPFEIQITMILKIALLLKSLRQIHVLWNTISFLSVLLRVEYEWHEFSATIVWLFGVEGYDCRDWISNW